MRIYQDKKRSKKKKMITISAEHAAYFERHGIKPVNGILVMPKKQEPRQPS